jgi:hypothetical protein
MGNGGMTNPLFGCNGYWIGFGSGAHMLLYRTIKKIKEHHLYMTVTLIHTNDRTHQKPYPLCPTEANRAARRRMLPRDAGRALGEGWLRQWPAPVLVLVPSTAPPAAKVRNFSKLPDCVTNTQVQATQFGKVWRHPARLGEVQLCRPSRRHEVEPLWPRMVKHGAAPHDLDVKARRCWPRSTSSASLELKTRSHPTPPIGIESVGNEAPISLSLSLRISLSYNPNVGYSFHPTSFPYPTTYFPQSKRHLRGIKLTPLM